MSKVPATPATRLLTSHDVAYTCHFYRYEEHGGTRVSARELGVDEHAVVKTLVMEDETATPLVVLMHGDREVSLVLSKLSDRPPFGRASARSSWLRRPPARPRRRGRAAENGFHVAWPPGRAERPRRAAGGRQGPSVKA